MKYLSGYVTPRKFGGFAIPISIQSKLLRSYANEIGMTYKLHQGELINEKSYMVLINMIKDLNKNEHIVMCSIFMFPKEKSKAEKIFKIIIEKNITMHFVFEDIEIKSTEINDFYNEKFFGFMIRAVSKENILKIFN